MKAALSIAVKDDFDRLVDVSSDVEGRLQGSRYDVNGIRKRKLDKNSNGSREYTAGISTSSAKPASSGSSAPTISYIKGHQILGAEVNGSFHLFLTDALGTVRDIVDDAGDVIQSYEFSEHGLPMPGSGAGSGTFSPKTYQGALSVNDDRADSGLYLMGHRHYAPELGRFISRDPIGFAGGLNLFGTAFGNNPVTKVDPSGLNPRPCSSDEMGTFSDALGVLTRLARKSGHTKYRNAAVSLSNLDRTGYVRVDDVLVTDLAETRRGLQIGSHGINLRSSLFYGGSFKRLCEFPEERFDRAVLAAGVLFHEDWHWNNWSNYDNREPAAWAQELDFYRDLLLSEISDGNTSRLDTIWQIGADRLAAGRAAGHVPTSPNFFDYRGQVLGSP